MDYKELINGFRAYADRWERGDQLLLTGELQLGNALRDAADAIETLLEERDAALNDLRGMCWCCINGQRWEKSKNLVTCDHLKQQGILAAGGSRKCDYWQWRGPKKEN